MPNWYVSSVKYALIPQWAASQVVAIGAIRRQLTVSSGNERCFVCTTAGTTGAVEPVWVLTKAGNSPSDNGVIWQECSGRANLNGDGGGTAWAAAGRQIAFGFTCAVAGDTVFVAHNHAESNTSGITMTPAGTASSWVRAICVNDAVVPPTTLATTATVSVSGGSSLSFAAGFAYTYGISFNCAGSSTGHVIGWTATTTDTCWVHERATFNQTTTSATGMPIGSSSATAVARRVKWIDCWFKSSLAGHSLSPRVDFEWIGGGIEVATSPTLLLSLGTGNSPKVRLENLDLTRLTTGRSVMTGVQTAQANVEILNCRLGAGGTILSAKSNGAAKMKLRMNNTDESNTVTRHESYDGLGENVTDTAIFKTTAGASDGTTPHSIRMLTTASAVFQTPHVTDPIMFWNNTPDEPITVNIPIIHDSATALRDDQCWVEVSYPDATNTQYAVITDRHTNIITNGTDQPTDTTAWTGTGGFANPNKQLLSVTFTPLRRGPIYVRVALALASKTIYFDPEPFVGSRQYKAECLYLNEPTVTVGGGGETSHIFQT